MSIINAVSEHIFTQTDINQFMSFPLERLSVRTEDGDEELPFYGYETTGFKFYLCNTSALNENSEHELRLVIQYLEHNPYGFIFVNGIHSGYIRHINTESLKVKSKKTWVPIDTMSIAQIFLALQQLANTFTTPSQLSEPNPNLMREFIINVE